VTIPHEMLRISRGEDRAGAVRIRARGASIDNGDKT